MSTNLSQQKSCEIPTYKRFPLTIRSGRGAKVISSAGEEYLDLYGGHAVAATGHCHPKVVAAIQQQAANLLFYSNVVDLEIRQQATQALIDQTAQGLDRAFFVNSGSEANENAIKLARKYSQKPGIVSFQGGYHGRTLSALSATGIPKYQQGISPLMPYHEILPTGDLAKLEDTLRHLPIGGVILEPIQSMAGVHAFPTTELKAIRELCTQYQTLLIFDEVQTGMGRLGRFFFAGQDQIVPDIMTLAKGLASGVPMGAMVVSEEISATLNYGDLGSTFGGGPLASAALQATIQTILEEKLLDNVRIQASYLKKNLLEFPEVEDVLGSGFLMGIKFSGGAAPIQQKLFTEKILTGLSGNPQVLRLLPPLCLSREEIDTFLTILKKCLGD